MENVTTFTLKLYRKYHTEFPLSLLPSLSDTISNMPLTYKMTFISPHMNKDTGIHCFMWTHTSKHTDMRPGRPYTKQFKGIFFCVKINAIKLSTALSQCRIT